MPHWSYTKGLHDLGGGCWAWLQPDGSWGWSNAGLVTDGEASLLVDTLFDLRLTGEMLAAMRDAEPAASRIDTLVNTHANGDHCYGNQLLEGADIVASRACAEEMKAVPPDLLAALVRSAHELGPAGDFLSRVFGHFDFEGIVLTPPTRTFTGREQLRVGDKTLELIQVGPAHTRGDVLVHVPEERLLYTGDILFADAHPILWEGPIGNWIRACDEILALDPQVIVPGHGAISDTGAVVRLRDYLVSLEREARARFDAGLGVAEAAREIWLSEHRSWADAERIAVNVHTLYREFAADPTPADPVELFGLMAELEASSG